MTAPRLTQIQSRFWQFITAPNGVEQAIPEMETRDPESVPVCNWVRAENEKEAIQRLDVYADMYFFRLLDALKEEFSILKQCVGDRTFNGLISDYLLSYPSNNSSMNYLGRYMGDFLEANPFVGMPPWLPDLARFERSLEELILAEDGAYLTLEQLQEVPPEQWGGLCFRIAPSVRIVELGYPIHLVWSDLLEKREPRDIGPEPTRYVFWRKDFGVSFDALDVLGGAAFEMILDGQPFGYACGAFLPDDIDPTNLDPAMVQEAVTKAHEALSRWLNRGLLASYQEFVVPGASHSEV